MEKGTHMPGALHGSLDFVAQHPLPVLLFKADREQSRLLCALPDIPVPHIRVVVHEAGVPALLPCGVLAFHGREVVVRVHVRGEDERFGVRTVHEVGRGGGRGCREGADELRRLRGAAEIMRSVVPWIFRVNI